MRSPRLVLTVLETKTRTACQVMHLDLGLPQFLSSRSQVTDKQLHTYEEDDELPLTTVEAVYLGGETALILNRCSFIPNLRIHRDKLESTLFIISVEKKIEAQNLVSCQPCCFTPDLQHAEAVHKAEFVNTPIHIIRP